MNKVLGLLMLARYHATPREPDGQPANLTYIESGARDEYESSEPHDHPPGDADEQQQQ